jgi:outer membrane usher protein
MSRLRLSKRTLTHPVGRSLLALCMAVSLASGTAYASEREDWYLAAHNHLDTGLSVMIVTLDDGSRWLRIIDLKLLHLPVPAVSTRMHAGEAIVPLSSLALAVDIDTTGARLHLLDHGKTASSEATEDLVLDMSVNGQALPEAQIARRRGDSIFLSKATLAAARLVPAGDAIRDDWVSVAALAGQHYVLDEQRMRLEITADPSRFQPTLVHAGGHRSDDTMAVSTRTPLAAIVGYDVVAGRAADGTRSASLLLDTAVSKGHVSCHDRQLWRSAQLSSRLESTCFVDWPGQRFSLVLGDAISRTSTLSGPVRYGGVRFGTDFGLQPQMQTQPLLGVEGSARLPSVLEVWIAQQLAVQTEVPPGRFSLDGVPAQSGRGQLEAVITDALGRQVLMNSPFYSDPNLLRTGLTDWSMELGRLRESFLTRDDHYGDSFGLFSYRRGLSSFWTFESRVELKPAHRLLGLASYLRLGAAGVAELSIAQSTDDGQTGRSHAAGYTYQGLHWNMGVRYAAYDIAYRDLAYPIAGTAPARDGQASAGMRVGRMSVSAGAILRDSRTFGEQRLGRVGVSLPVGRGYLNVTAFRAFAPAGDTSFTAIYTLPLENQRSLSTWVNGANGALDPGITLQRSLPSGPGYGYRVLQEASPFGPRTDVEGALRGNAGLVDASLLRTNEGADARVEASGAWIATRDGFFLAPDDGGSFALVTMPQADARILREHQFSAHTRADGKAIVSGLRPFEHNRLDVAAESLDPSSRLTSSALDVVPGRRDVVAADFGASRAIPLTLHVTTMDRVAIPAGAVARLPDRDAVPLGYDGVLYLEMTAAPAPITIEWQEHHCVIPADALPVNPDPALVYEARCQ